MSSNSGSPGYEIKDVAKIKEKTRNNHKRKKRHYESVSKIKQSKGIYNTGRWTRQEHFKFLEALKLFGKEWQKVQQHVFSRTSTQARSHAQKFFGKLEKKQLTLEDFLEKLDIEQLKSDLKLNENGNSTEYNEDLPLINIINMKNKSSVLNIAMPHPDLEMQEEEREIIKTPEKLICDDPPPLSYQMEYHNNQIDAGMNDMALNNIKIDDDPVSNIHSQEFAFGQSKRATMQRKAKTNHAFCRK